MSYFPCVPPESQDFEDSGGFGCQNCYRVSISLPFHVHSGAVSHNYKVRGRGFCWIPIAFHFVISSCLCLSTGTLSVGGPPSLNTVAFFPWMVRQSSELWEHYTVVVILTLRHCLKLISEEIKGLI